MQMKPNRTPSSHRWPVTLLLGAACFALAPSWPAQAGAPGGFAAPVNPEYLQYREAVRRGTAVTRTEDGHPLGYAPSPLDLSHIDPRKIVLPGVRLHALPESYDLRPLGLVSPVKNQNPYGTCWSFGALGSLESTFLKAVTSASGSSPESAAPHHQISGTLHDFAEWHLAYFAYVDQNPSLPAFTQNAPAFGADPIFDQGGNHWMSAAILARWTGAVNEADRPYQNTSPYPPESVPLSTDPVAKHLEHVFYLGTPFTEDLVKNAVVTYGALAFRMIWANGAFNIPTNAYYNSTGAGGGHIITLVGWDDNFPAANFLVNPGRNGAWLAKNSWSAAFGDGGYFWISYEDPTIGYPAIFQGGSATNFDKIYQYDPLGWVSSWGYRNNTAWFANVFTASEPEALQAVSFYAGAPGATYTIEVWTGGTGGNPRSGTSAMAPLEGTLAVPGYHTVRLATPVPLAPGTRFAVVVRLTTPGYNFPIAVENPDAGYSDKATAAADQSYVSSDGTAWTDLVAASANTNVCLKAFTSDGTALACQALLPGHGAGGHAASLDVLLRPAAGGADTAVAVNSLADGTFTVSPPSGGSWHVSVKERRTLATVRTGAPGGDVLDFGTLRAGDANNDNKVTIVDFSILATTFGKSAGDVGYDDRADFNGDGKVTIVDFSLLASNFGTNGDALPEAEAGEADSAMSAPEKPAGSSGSSSGEASGCQVAPGLGAVLLALPLGLVFWKN